MSGFIKVIDKMNRVQYLNVNYIVKITPLGEERIAKAIIFTTSETIEVLHTVEEILDIINLSKN
ncbi:MAG: hypothetical protein BGO88_08940 [Flavobacterium sp. 38-13]|nr:MAG: hypothetical protein BGO88_08940 [Flavobacterium sp. 38-13]